MKAPLPRSKTYARNSERCKGFNPCVICGQPIHPETTWLWVTEGGATMQTVDEPADKAGDTGFHPIGPACAQKPAVRPFLIKHPHRPT